MRHGEPAQPPGHQAGGKLRLRRDLHRHRRAPRELHHHPHRQARRQRDRAGAGPRGASGGRNPARLRLQPRGQ